MYFHNFAKKSLGQNYLIDKNIIKKIINIGNISNKKNIIEIGPGYGSLTDEIHMKNPKKIIAIEKDNKLSLYLQKKFKDYNNINIINDDILNFIHKNKTNEKTIVFGNLPYNISTQILASFITQIKHPPWFEILIFMFQKEVADRILAKKNSKNYGRLTILCNWSLEIKKHFNISRNCFAPKPKIDSTILSFKPKKRDNFNIKNLENLEMVTRILFSNRRKMINKSFLKLFNNNKLIAKDLNLNLSLRPEELSNEMFYKITMKYEELFS